MGTTYKLGGYDPSKPGDNIDEDTPDVPDGSAVLGQRVDASLDQLRDGINAFDTATAAQRWQTVKVALRIVLALARLQRGRTEVDG